MPSFPGSEAVLVLGCYRHTLGALRSLAGAGYRVLQGRTAPQSFCDTSHAVRGTWRYPPLDHEDPAVVHAALGKLLRSRPEIRYVFPVDQTQVEFFHHNPPDLPPGVILVLANRKAVDVCVDKTKSALLFAELGVPHAPFAFAENLEELRREVAALGYPCIVKPDSSVYGIHGHKAVICHDRAELDERIPTWPDPCQRVMAQRCATGLRHNFYFAASEGRVLTSMDVRTLRTDRPDGTGYSVVGETVDIADDLLAHTESIARRLDYHGVGCVQYLVDATSGQTITMEVNPRLGATCSFQCYCGLELPVMAVQLARGEAPGEDMRARWPGGRRYHWLLGDLDGFRVALRRGELSLADAGRWLAHTASDCCRADMHLTWDERDPRPTFDLWRSTVASLTRDAASGVLRRLGLGGAA